MSDLIVIRLDGPPRGKGRHRARLVTRTNGPSFMHHHPDAKTERYEKALRNVAAIEMIGRRILAGPMVVVVYAHFPIPKSWTQAKKRQARQGLIVPVTKPDWDNIAKVCDALNGVVWGDDAAVARDSVVKAYSDVPELIITVEPWVPAIATIGTSVAALDEAA